MITTAVIQTLQTHALVFRLGRSLEVMEDFVATIGEILPYLVGKQDDGSPTIEVILSGILACQELEDWLGLADFIEYELISLLKSMPLSD